jgi:hypothetical protein
VAAEWLLSRLLAWVWVGVAVEGGETAQWFVPQLVGVRKGKKEREQPAANSGRRRKVRSVMGSRQDVRVCVLGGLQCVLLLALNNDAEEAGCGVGFDWAGADCRTGRMQTPGRRPGTIPGLTV